MYGKLNWYFLQNITGMFSYTQSASYLVGHNGIFGDIMWGSTGFSVNQSIIHTVHVNEISLRL